MDGWSAPLSSQIHLGSRPYACGRASADHRGMQEMPAELLAEIDAAWQRASEPLEGRFALHFCVDEGRVRGELREADGRLARRLSARQALLLACGDARAVAA
jgi:hypothetical protein